MAYRDTGRRGVGWPLLIIVLGGGLAAYLFFTGEDGARALSVLQVVVGSLDILTAVYLARRGSAEFTPVGAGRRFGLWMLALLMVVVAAGLFHTSREAGIDAAPMTSAALETGQTVTWHPSAAGVARERLRFTGHLHNTDTSGFCERDSTLTAALIFGGSVRDEATASNGEPMELELGPGGAAREVRLTVAAPEACRMTIDITDAEFVS
ncbi:hypothetical protein GCM10010435_74450 [Winogradskya consettensis]|uniref:Uncharacterized protein n=1 Tax=Winogradskya consettensis TaxID=113560 RepID=A0A919SLJ2_9ACTN|nr:hypothetical protein [Actinoplanes consettensis]GIM75000.1 hypothetical protein Aco04nite_43130 [Actinoplanes consettensis]